MDLFLVVGDNIRLCRAVNAYTGYRLSLHLSSRKMIKVLITNTLFFFFYITAIIWWEMWANSWTEEHVPKKMALRWRFANTCQPQWRKSYFTACHSQREEKQSVFREKVLTGVGCRKLHGNISALSFFKFAQFLKNYSDSVSGWSSVRNRGNNK